VDSEIKVRLEASSNQSGVSFYKNLMVTLSEEMNINYVLIGKVNKEEKLVQAIVFAKENNSFNALIYEITGTPCEKVDRQGVYTHTNNVAESYPNDDLLTEMEIESYTGVSFKIGDKKGILVGLSIEIMKNSEDLVEVFSSCSTKVGDQLAEYGLELLDPASYL